MRWQHSTGLLLNMGLKGQLGRYLLNFEDATLCFALEQLQLPGASNKCCNSSLIDGYPSIESHLPNTLLKAEKRKGPEAGIRAGGLAKVDRMERRGGEARSNAE